MKLFVQVYRLPLNTLESFLSKVAFESNLRKKLSRIEHVLIVKVSFERRKISKVYMTHVQVLFRKSLSKATFERKHFSVSLTLVLRLPRVHYHSTLLFLCTSDAVTTRSYSLEHSGVFAGILVRNFL